MLFLVGEASLVIEGISDYCTEVIVAADVPEQKRSELCQVIDSSASEVGLAVAIEHPAEVIPLPLNAGNRNRKVSGFDDADSRLRIRHFDPYSVAIRFIARGDEPDYHLVLAMLEAEWITMKELEDEVATLLPRFSFETIQQDPAEFRRKFKGLRQMWGAHAVE
jgi:hypothetical protein